MQPLPRRRSGRTQRRCATKARLAIAGEGVTCPARRTYLRRPGEPNDPNAHEQTGGSLSILCLASAHAEEKARRGQCCSCTGARNRSRRGQGVRGHVGPNDNGKLPSDLGDRKLIDRHVKRIIVKIQAIEVHFNSKTEQPEGTTPGDATTTNADDHWPSMLGVPWSPSAFSEVKGILHAAGHRPATLNTRLDL